MNPNPVPATKAIPVFVYVPAVYQGNPPPQGAPCVDLLPWDRKAKKEAEAKQRAAIDAQKRQESLANAKKKTGFFNQLTAVVKDVAYQAEAAVESGVSSASHAVTDQMDKHSVSKFHTMFPQYGPDEKLLFATSGKVVSGAAPVSGDAFVSEHYLSFRGEYYDRNTVPGQSIKHAIIATIPLQSILCIQPAITVFGVDKTAAPTFQPVQDAATTPTALMIYTNTRQLHLLYQFSDYVDLFNVLDHHWRALVNTNMLVGFAPSPIAMTLSPQPPSFSMQPPPAYPNATYPSAPSAMPQPSAPPSDDHLHQKPTYPSLS